MLRSESASRAGVKAGVQEIGRIAPRFDAYAKVTGAEKFAADLYPTGFVWAGVKRSEYAHARILNIDTSRASAIPGILAVLTHRDISGKNRLGIFEKDQPILADDRVRHYGDAVALVVAENKEALARALAAVAVQYEPLSAVFDPATALAASAPILHPERPAGNVLLAAEIIQGNGADGLADCEVTASLAMSLGWQEHAFLETQNGVAGIDEAGELYMTVSTQTPFRDRLELAEALGIPPQRIHISAPCLGGGFGGKDGVTVQGFLALAAMHSNGRPVKLWYSREESILAGTKRHPLQAEYRIGCNRQGVLAALDCQLLFDTGAYAGMGDVVLALAMEHAGGPYRIPNVRINGKSIYTNNPVSSAFRGFGVPQVAAAIEQVMDELAKAGGFDPLEFRRKNVVSRGDCTPSGVVLSGTAGIEECLERLANHPLWTDRAEWIAAAPPFKRRGVGIAAAGHGVGFGPVVADYANAKLEILADGRIRVYAGVSDMGQGNASTYAQIVSHLLSQPYEAMELILPDSDKTLPSASSSASRTTFTYGKAMNDAALALKERLLARAGLLLSFQLLQRVKNDDLLLLPGKILHPASGKNLPLAMVAGFMDPAERIVTASHTSPVNSQVLSSGQELRMYGFPHQVFSYGAHLVQVEVDACTGEVMVCGGMACIDAGTVLNPQVYEQQVQGGMAQGLGYALFEEFGVAAGRITTSDFSTYILPTAADLPDMTVTAVTPHEAAGPFGMKGIGEISIDAVFPAVANALVAATGTRISVGPLTAENVLAALQSSGKEGRR